MPVRPRGGIGQGVVFLEQAGGDGAGGFRVGAEGFGDGFDEGLEGAGAGPFAGGLFRELGVEPGEELDVPPDLAQGGDAAAPVAVRLGALEHGERVPIDLPHFAGGLVRAIEAASFGLQQSAGMWFFRCRRMESTLTPGWSRTIILGGRPA